MANLFHFGWCILYFGWCLQHFWCHWYLGLCGCHLRWCIWHLEWWFVEIYVVSFIWISKRSNWAAAFLDTFLALLLSSPIRLPADWRSSSKLTQASQPSSGLGDGRLRSRKLSETWKDVSTIYYGWGCYERKWYQNRELLGALKVVKLTWEPGDDCSVYLQSPSFFGLRRVEFVPSVMTQEQSSSPKRSMKLGYVERSFWPQQGPFGQRVSTESSSGHSFGGVTCNILLAKLKDALILYMWPTSRSRRDRMPILEVIVNCPSLKMLSVLGGSSDLWVVGLDLKKCHPKIPCCTCGSILGIVE